jgi:osmotically-inducible protein OsmY
MRRYDELLLGIGIGAGLMYLWDPDRGRRRRALLRDQIVRGAHEMQDLREDIRSRARHLENRARGLALETSRRFRREEVPDAVLAARVRAELGRVTADPGAIEVSAEHGRVTLRGTLAPAEMASLIEKVQAVPGVHDVINRMEAQEPAG